MSENNNKNENSVTPEKENCFKKWFNKTKNDVKDSMLESKIESTFNKNNMQFTIGTYNKDALIQTTKCIFGYFDKDGTFVTFGDNDFAPFSIFVNDKTNDAYMIVEKVGPTPIEINVDDIKYIRSGTRFNVSQEVKEVNVVKINGKFYLYEGK